MSSLGTWESVFYYPAALPKLDQEHQTTPDPVTRCSTLTLLTLCRISPPTGIANIEPQASD
jgi:hypothetical protein